MGNKFIAGCLGVLMVASLGGCASSPGSISASYVSPLQYQSYDCEQIAQEMHRTTHKVQEVTGVQSEKAAGDALVVGVSLIVFWPALLLLAQGEDKSAELARLKGEAEALEQAAVQKKCTVLLDQIEQERKAAKKKEAETTE